MRLSHPRSITLRLTLFFASVSTVVLLGLGLLVGNLVERHFEEMDAESLDGKMALLRNVIEKANSPDALKGFSNRLEDALIGHPGLAVLVMASDGQSLYIHGDMGIPASTLKEKAAVRQSQPMIWRGTNQMHYRGIAREVVPGFQGANPVMVIVATDMAQHEHFMSSFRAVLWPAVGLAALVTGLLGWGVSRRGMAPLREISQKAAGITADSLDHRLATEAFPAEMAEVAETLNAMLERLQASFHRLSDFSADLAHELRTPLANLMTQTQVMLSKPRTAEDYRDTLVSNTEELERLSRMVSDMLFLAKAENNLVVPSQEDINLADELFSLGEFYEALAEESQVKLKFSGSGHVVGDRLMLRRAINNLLSNAVRHTPAGGEVTVKVQSHASEISISIQNTGETIPPEHLPRLFDRFYRADPSRQRFSEGAGLGLAITQSIVHAHGGRIDARSRDGLTEFEIVLPLSPS